MVSGKDIMRQTICSGGQRLAGLRGRICGCSDLEYGCMHFSGLRCHVQLLNMLS